MNAKFLFQISVLTLGQVVVPPAVLDAAEAKWAPPDDPVFQIVPSDFKSYLTQCFEDLGKPEVNFETFWDVYCGLRDLVGVAVPGNVTVTLSESTGDGDNGMLEPFALAHLKELDLGVDGEGSEGYDEDGEDVEEEFPHVDFTNEEGGDELF